MKGRGSRFGKGPGKANLGSLNIHRVNAAIRRMRRHILTELCKSENLSSFANMGRQAVLDIVAKEKTQLPLIEQRLLIMDGKSLAFHS